jgi:hypothetical protein
MIYRCNGDVPLPAATKCRLRPQADQRVEVPLSTTFTGGPGVFRSSRWIAPSRCSSTALANPPSFNPQPSHRLLDM